MKNMVLKSFQQTTQVKASKMVEQDWEDMAQLISIMDWLI